MKTNVRHLLSAVLLAGFVFLAFGSDDEKKTQSDISSKAPAVTVSAIQLYEDYEANGVAADQKYKGKVLRVTGTVNSIDKDITDTVYITLTGNEFLGSIQCFFSDEHIAAASALNKGEVITVKGLCEGKIMNVLLKGCVIE